MRFGITSVLICLSLLADGCASTPKTNEDSRLEVAAAVSSRRREITTDLLYTVRIRNVGERTLKIRRVEVEPIGGGHVRPAYVTASKDLEPGEPADFQVWAELESRETVIGIGDALARVIVSFDDGPQKAMGTYLVNLK